jgi:uncharacterized protein
MSEEPITDLVHIEQTSKANEQENLDFRAFVKADLDLSDYRLHGIVKQATQEVWAHIDCRTCANCCKTRHPLFSRVEVQRIADYLGMTAAELRARYLEIDQEAAKYITRELPCPFLKDNLCSIYDVRPSVCVLAIPTSTATFAIGSGKRSITPRPARSSSTCWNV